MTTRADHRVAHRFGGVWTEIKLKALADYLQFYQSVLRGEKFETWYVDAFAGTGDRHALIETGGIFDAKPHGLEERLLEGSARKALRIDPPFDHFWFAEQNKKLAELQKVLEERPHGPTFCSQCGKHLTGGHERDGSNHCWGHDEDED